MFTDKLVKILLTRTLHHYKDTTRSVQDGVEELVVDEFLMHEERETELDNVSNLLKALILLDLSWVDANLV